jgi:hypothetical protein
MVDPASGNAYIVGWCKFIIVALSLNLQKNPWSEQGGKSLMEIGF